MSGTKYRSVVVLTGAGVSAESGIATFRDKGGLWENFDIEEYATAEALQRDPVKVLSFYNDRRNDLLNPTIQPNAAHEALAQLEREFDGNFLLVTQNIDNLHERAGNDNVIHMHGELSKYRCMASGQVFEVEGEITHEHACACCSEPGRLRPHVVFFGEMPFEMERIQLALHRCDLFISIGTSGTVYPAADFVRIARHSGAHTVELNLEPSEVQSLFHEQQYGPATEIIPRYVQRVL